jgi:regulatory protein
MKIIALQNRRKCLTALKLENGEELLLDTEIVIMRDLKPGVSIDDPDALLYESDFKRAKSRALWYLSRGDLSEKGLTEKLKTAGFGEKAAQAAVERMAELGLIDDEKYARRLLESLTMSGASEKEIYFKLKNKGISSDIAKEVLSESETDESEKIKGLLYTKYQNKLETQEGVQKVIASLARKGFSFADIKDALRAYNEEIICEEDI